jgi:hypothetical protein
MTTPAADSVWETVRALNRTWTVDRDPEGLRRFFHREMVVIDPVHPERVEGQDAVVTAYGEFLRTVPVIHYWRERDPKVQLYGNGQFAVVTYYYDMSYDMDGRAVTTSGRDMYTLVREGGRWWAVADQFSPRPGETP